MRVPKKAITTADLERSGIPRKYWKCRFDLIPDTAKYKPQVARYLRDLDTEVEAGKGVFITHPLNGTGKTAVACIIGKRGLLRGFTVYYTMSETYKSNVVRNVMFDEFQRVYDRAREVDILILDDFGKEFKGDSGWIESEIENLIRERVQAEKTTILTTNGTPDSVAKVYSKDLASVLLESVYVLVVGGSKDGGKEWRPELSLGVMPQQAAVEEDEEW